MAVLNCMHLTELASVHTELQSYPELSSTLPDGYEYHLCSFSPLEGGFDATVRVALQDEEGATEWLADYQEHSRVTLRVKATKPESGRVNLFKVYYRCHHNTIPRSEKADLRPKSKNTNCPAQLTITVKRNPGKRSQAKVRDPHLPLFATIVHIKHIHNHQIACPDAFKFRDVSKDVIAKFTELYSKGYSPSSALNTHKLDLQLEHENDYLYVSADRAQCPDLQFCHRLYKKMFDKAYGAASGEKMIQDLGASIESYNEEQGLECCKMDQVNGKMVIAVCTPLMRRIHSNHRCSGELVFVDASAGIEKYDCRLFMILTHSVAGGLPLGCLITTSESREAIVAALKLYKQLIPDDGFYGRGDQGPVVFLTDDSDGERQGLQEVFPNSSTILCVFHLLQATWRFLWEGKNSICEEDRPHLLDLVKGMVYADTAEHLEENYDRMNRDAIVKKYSCFLKYAKHLYNRRQLWAVCFRRDLPLGENNVTNYMYVEAAMRILKDQIFRRVRAYNPVQLLDFVLTRLVSYYERSLCDLANGRIDVTISKRYLPGKGRITAEMVNELQFPLFEVQSESEPEKKYQVDMSVAMCTCTAGLNGAPCKHQYAVVEFRKVQSFTFPPIHDEIMRRRLLFLATGQETGDIRRHEDRGNSTQEFRLEDLEAGLHSMAATLTDQMREYPEELAPAVRAFITQFKNLKTHSATVSALMAFGKQHEVAQSFRSSTARRSQKRGSDQGATNHCRSKKQAMSSYW
ncbi:uncharacterized protein LOC119744514 [Patiria miniata]|uniref:SWIM-type domain-containing protein n=1 Tax=Patiria miniata TaxID=46514 RepID=A0A914BJW5_PATMI|nr:uncharacterized protein LOC119744514 [Patiria miniata]